MKRSVSFEAQVWDELQRTAGSGSVSSLVNDAVRVYLRRQAGLRGVAEFEAEHGALTPGELAEADRALAAAGVVPRARRRRSASP